MAPRKASTRRTALGALVWAPLHFRSMTTEGELEARRRFVATLFAERKDLIVAGTMTLGPLPCGERKTYTAESFPIDDTPCPCGNVRHWIVMWAHSEAKL